MGRGLMRGYGTPSSDQCLAEDAGGRAEGGTGGGAVENKEKGTGGGGCRRAEGGGFAQCLGREAEGGAGACRRAEG